MKTAAPNLRAGEKLQIARDKFQESIDGNTESFIIISFVTVSVFTLIKFFFLGLVLLALLLLDLRYFKKY